MFGFWERAHRRQRPDHPSRRPFPRLDCIYIGPSIHWDPPGPVEPLKRGARVWAMRVGIDHARFYISDGPSGQPAAPAHAHEVFLILYRVLGLTHIRGTTKGNILGLVARWPRGWDRGERHQADAGGGIIFWIEEETTDIPVTWMAMYQSVYFNK